jgi:hypothetical protein
MSHLLHRRRTPSSYETFADIAERRDWLRDVWLAYQRGADKIGARPDLSDMTHPDAAYVVMALAEAADLAHRTHSTSDLELLVRYAEAVHHAERVWRQAMDGDR